MGELVEVRVYPHRKEGDAEVALMRFPEGFGGGGGAGAFSAWSTEVQVGNNGADVVVPLNGQIDLDQGGIVDNAPAGAYSVKLHAMWGAGSALSLGAAQLTLIHIADDDTESLLASLVMSPEYPAIGDMDLSDIHFTGDKIDMGVAPTDGRLELRAMQSTDQNFMTLTARIVVAKL